MATTNKKINVLGIGNSACKIVSIIGKNKEYQTFKIDTEKKRGTKNSFHIFKKVNVEDYENMEELPQLKIFLNKINGDDVFVFINGGGLLSALSLVVMQHLHEKGNKINVIYLQPDIGVLNEIKRLHERTVFNVLQEYARSGLFERMLILDHHRLDETAGNVSVYRYWDSINETVAWLFHMLNFFENNEPVLSRDTTNPAGADRIHTLGIEKEKEILFFPIDKIREKVYYCLVPEKVLNSDKDFLSDFKKNYCITEENLRISYFIYSADEDKEKQMLIVYKSNQIQTRQ